MKPVEYVSIGGCVFSFEEDACAAAKIYIDQLTEFYAHKKSGLEIMEGIEERMSELLFEQLGTGEVVTLSMVNAVIGVLGRPEVIEDEEEEEDEVQEAPSQEHARQEAHPKPEEKPRKRIYRDPANGRFAGVCSGLGTFTGVDPTVFRLIFVILTIAGFSMDWMRFRPFRVDFSLTIPLVYAILWICMPVVKTVRQRDAMNGEKGTVDAISARIQRGNCDRQTTPGARSAAVLSSCWHAVEVTMGMLLLFVGVMGLTGAGIFTWGKDLFGSTSGRNSFMYNRMMEEMAEEAPYMLDLLSYAPAMFVLSLVALIPFVAMVYAGVILSFGLKAPKWHPGLCMFAAWIIAIAIFIVMALFAYSG